MKKLIIVSLSCFFLFGCCDEKSPRSQGPAGLVEQRSTQSFVVGDMVKARVDGRIGQIGAIDTMDNKVYWVRFESNKPRMKIREFEIEKIN